MRKWLGNELEGIVSVVTKSVEAAAMRALLEQCRMDVSWWRGGLRAIGLPPVPGGVSGSTPPLMMSHSGSWLYSVGDQRQ